MKSGASPIFVQEPSRGEEMRSIVVLLTALVLASATQAQDKRVSPQDSRILLLAPYLEDLTPRYEYFGWNARGSVEGAYGGVARSNAPAARAQVYLEQTAPLTYWRSGSTIDPACIGKFFPFFKDKNVQMTSPAPSPGPFVRVARFEVDGAKCAAFELRHVTNDTGTPTLEQRQSISGIYCPPANVVLDDALMRRVFEGIFVRRDGRLERALSGVDKPIPPAILRSGQKQG
jgi:hypothetical protein